MNLSKLNEAFNTIVKKQVELNSCNFQDHKYKEICSQLKQLKTDFQSEYGSDLHEALFEVHDENCTDNEVLLPNSFIASSYQEANASSIFELKQ